MAVHLPGSLASAVSGKLGDIVFLRGQGGPAVRSIGTWDQPNTDLQLEVRAIITALSAAWSATLTEQQREGWRVYGDAHPRPNRWGSPTFQSGYLTFVRHNFHAYRQADAIVFPNAPTAPPLHSPNLQLTVQQNGSLSITGTLGPDATGLYHPGPMYLAHPTWLRTDQAFSLWRYPPTPAWILSTAPGAGAGNWWVTNGTIGNTLYHQGTYTGNAVPTWTYAGSLAKIQFPPINYPDPSPFLQVYTYSGKPISQGRTFYNGPWSFLATFVPPTPATTAPAWLRWTWPLHATGDPYAWNAEGTDSARLYAVIQNMLTGARSTRHVITPTFGSLAPW